MIGRIAISRTYPFPALKFTNIRSYVFTLVFVLLNIAVPRLFHQFHLAGPTFLPMHFFIFIAGLMYGWRFGMVVGLLTPLASYAVSGLPALTVLPQITAEAAIYGLVAGILRERFSLKPVWALLGAMVAGRVALLLTVTIIFLGWSRIYSPLGPQATPLTAVWSTISQGWPGIAIQLVSVPVFVWLAGRLGRKPGADSA